MGPRDLEREVVELKKQLHRNQVYLVATLAVIGVSLLLSVGLVGVYGLRLGDHVREVKSQVGALAEDSKTRSKALSFDLARQQRELDAIRQAANDDLKAIQEAHRKISEIRDPAKDLSVLHEANEALWSELASQRA